MKALIFDEGLKFVENYKENYYIIIN